MVETNTERIGGATMLYALKNRNCSRRVTNHIIVLPLEQPLLPIQWRWSWIFPYHHRRFLAMMETNTERIGGATMLYTLKIRNGSIRLTNQITVLPLEQLRLFTQLRLSWSFQSHHTLILAGVEASTNRIGGATMLYTLKNRNGSRRVANQIIVLPLEQPLLLIQWRLSTSFQCHHRLFLAMVETNT
jgi:hypothetical protein